MAGISSITHFDERGAAYFALGQARATGKPAALVCTSGTAVANLLPAVVEACQDNIPLILLTADRPPELRSSGANQTIHQPGLFGRYVRWEHELPCPEGSLDPHLVLTAIDQACARATEQPSGPVHLNIPFREPLAPVEDGVDLSTAISALNRWLDSGKPFTSYHFAVAQPDSEVVNSLASVINAARRGLLVAGRLQSGADRSATTALARELGWPVYADTLSGIVHTEWSLDRLDLLLSANQQIVEPPDVVLRCGGPLVSKAVTQWLSHAEQFIAIQTSPERLDPHFCVTHRVAADIAETCEMLRSKTVPSAASQWWERLCRLNQNADSLVRKELDAAARLTQVAIIKALMMAVPVERSIMVGSSLPIRDCEQFRPSVSRRWDIIGNRGASGIDGTLATACGYAFGTRRPVLCLLGDQALLHDLNSLALATRSPVPVKIALLNNGGGQIFGQLPIGKFPELLDKYFTALHQFDFSGAARMFGIPHRECTDLTSLDSACREFFATPETCLLEFHIEPTYDRDFRSRLTDQLRGLR